MTLTELASWLTTREITALANAATIAGLLVAVVVPLAVYLLNRLRKRETLPEVPTPVLAQSSVAPRTWWEYLTDDLELSQKARKACAGLYEIGWEQLNRPTNNRQETKEETEARLHEIGEALTKEEIASAEELGINLASNPDDSHTDVESHLHDLSPEGQSYARLIATIRSIERDTAVDLALGIPLTDFREVKKALKEEIPPAHILDHLPLAWRMIRTINDPRPRRRAFQQEIRPTLIRLTVHTESGPKEDDRAELDEDWVVSEKLDMLLPFTGIVPVYDEVEEGQPQILKDRRMIYTGHEPPGSESKLWTRGGYLDRMQDRAARGEHPAQLRRAARRKRVLWTIHLVSLAVLATAIVFRLAVELS